MPPAEDPTRSSSSPGALDLALRAGAGRASSGPGPLAPSSGQAKTAGMEGRAVRFNIFFLLLFFWVKLSIHNLVTRHHRLYLFCVFLSQHIVSPLDLPQPLPHLLYLFIVFLFQHIVSSLYTPPPPPKKKKKKKKKFPIFSIYLPSFFSNTSYLPYTPPPPPFPLFSIYLLSFFSNTIVSLLYPPPPPLPPLLYLFCVFLSQHNRISPIPPPPSHSSLSILCLSFPTHSTPSPLFYIHFLFFFSNILFIPLPPTPSLAPFPFFSVSPQHSIGLLQSRANQVKLQGRL